MAKKPTTKSDILEHLDDVNEMGKLVRRRKLEVPGMTSESLDYLLNQSEFYKALLSVIENNPEVFGLKDE